jgi:SAM-dependent methyltransferase
METSELIDIYIEQAERYERLVAREDYLGNILPALEEICDFNGRVVVEMGVGTGRLAKLLAPAAEAVYGFDNSIGMLRVGRRELQGVTADNWLLAVADHRDLPLRPASCDLVLSGWSLCYLALDQEAGWEDRLRRLFRRLRRMLRPGGAIIILETMGTGFREPNPPPLIDDYFSFFANLGLQSKWFPTH